MLNCCTLFTYLLYISGVAIPAPPPLVISVLAVLSAYNEGRVTCGLKDDVTVVSGLMGRFGVCCGGEQ